MAAAARVCGLNSIHGLFAENFDYIHDEEGTSRIPEWSSIAELEEFSPVKKPHGKFESDELLTTDTVDEIQGLEKLIVIAGDIGVELSARSVSDVVQADDGSIDETATVVGDEFSDNGSQDQDLNVYDVRQYHYVGRTHIRICPDGGISVTFGFPYKPPEQLQDVAKEIADVKMDCKCTPLSTGELLWKFGDLPEFRVSLINPIGYERGLKKKRPGRTMSLGSEEQIGTGRPILGRHVSYSVAADAIKLNSETCAWQRETVKQVCHFCKECKAPDWFSWHHTLSSLEDKRITCPRLRAMLCELCGALGDNAHTQGRCPTRKRQTSLSWSSPEKMQGCGSVQEANSADFDGGTAESWETSSEMDTSLEENFGEDEFGNH